jgi:hypothetical protein
MRLLLLLLLGQDISSSSKHRHRASDGNSLTTTSPSKQAVAKTSRERIVGVNVERSLSAPKSRTVTEAHHECQLDISTLMSNIYRVLGFSTREICKQVLLVVAKLEKYMIKN